MMPGNHCNKGNLGDGRFWSNNKSRMYLLENIGN